MSMQPAPELTLAFLQGRPMHAAEVLGELEHETAALFLESIPARVAAPAFSMMHPDDAASVLQRMHPVRAAALVRAVSYADALTVLRLLPESARQTLYRELPSRFAEEVSRSLLYPFDTVGAWMEPSVPAFRAQSTVSDVTRYLRRHNHALLDHVFVVGAGRQLEGAVATSELLRADAGTALSAIMSRALRPLSNRARLLLAAEDPAWDAYAVLPVAGRKGNILGGLSRAQVRRGVRSLREDPPARELDNAVSHVLGALMLSAVGLMRAAAGGGQR
jgi:magnesium transporter